MMTILYNQEEITASYGESMKEEGRQEGRQEGIEKGMKMSAIRMKESGIKTQDISTVLKVDEKKVREWVGETEESASDKDQ